MKSKCAFGVLKFDFRRLFRGAGKGAERIEIMMVPGVPEEKETLEQNAPGAANGLMRAVFFIALAVAFAAVALRVWLNIMYVNPDTGLFETGFVYHTVFIVALALITVGVLAASFFNFRKYRAEKLAYPGYAVIFSSSMNAFMLVSSALIQIYYLVFNYAATYSMDSVPNIVVIVLSFPMAAFFFINASTKFSGSRRTPLAQLFYLFPILWLSVRLMSSFVVFTRNVNVPGEQLQLASLCALLLYFVYESRLSRKSGKCAGYFCVGILTVVFVFVSAIPSLILTLFWIMGEAPAHPFYLAVEIMMGVYVAVQVFSNMQRLRLGEAGKTDAEE